MTDALDKEGKPIKVCSCWLGEQCNRIGKHPAVNWRAVTVDSPSPGRLEGGGVGLRTGAQPYGSGIVVVDLDTADAAAEWDRRGGAGGDTRTVRTGRPGLQLYFLHPGFPVRNSVGSSGGMFPGIDIRGDGGFVVMPGSLHKSGRTYTTLNPDVEIAPMPAWLVEWLRAQPAPAETQDYDGDVTDEVERERRRTMFIEYLETAPPCVQGQGGDQRLFDVVQYGAWDLALPVDDVLALIEEHFDPRCDPPWGAELEERVLHKADYAKTKSTRPRKVPLHVEEENEWKELLDRPKPNALAELSEALLGETKIEPMLLAKALVETAMNEARVVEEEPDPFKIKWDGWKDPPLPPEWLIDSLLVENKVTMVYADPGSIKTWLAISIALAVASGEPWLGERGVRSGPVLYIDFEDGESEFHRRRHLLGGADVDGLGFAYSPGSLLEVDFWKKIAQVVQKRKIKLVVLDTLASGSPGVDENAKVAGDPMIYAGKITEACPWVSFLILHHANKSGGLRGHSSFTANVDTLFKLEKEESKEQDVEYAKLSCVKSGQKKVHPIELRLSNAGGLERRAYEKQGGVIDVDLFGGSMNTNDESEKDMRTFEELRAECLLTIEQRGPLASIEGIRTILKARKSNVSAVIAELSEGGHIVRLSDGWVRDNEALRKDRLREAVRAYPDVARKRIVEEAFIEPTYFDSMLRKGFIRPISSDPSIPGYVWVEGHR